MHPVVGGGVSASSAMLCEAIREVGSEGEWRPARWKLTPVYSDSAEAAT